jgi:two-component system cell cycle response regulator DivK
MIPMILVADDDKDNRAIMSAVLEAAGYRVLLACDGVEAIDAAMKELPDLILLDMSMPRLSGWDAIKRLKSAPRTAAIPVFAFTAHALAGDELKTREAGCDGYVAKPCLPRDVVAKIANKIGRPS